MGQGHELACRRIAAILGAHKVTDAYTNPFAFMIAMASSQSSCCIYCCLQLDCCVGGLGCLACFSPLQLKPTTGTSLRFVLGVWVQGTTNMTTELARKSTSPITRTPLAQAALTSQTGVITVQLLLKQQLCTCMTEAHAALPKHATASCMVACQPLAA